MMFMHRHFTAFTGHFDPYYFPELLYIPEFEYFMNFRMHYAETVADKNLLPLLAKAAGVRMPRTICSAVNGLVQNAQKQIISLREAAAQVSGPCFLKPSIDSCSGQGCLCANIEHPGGVDTLTGRPIEDILASAGQNWVLQEQVVCHESIRKIYPHSVNTFRVMTYIWRGEICHVPSIMRIGQGGGFLDNAHAGGVFIAIDDDGSLHDTAFTEFRSECKKHPDTGGVFKDIRLEGFPKVLSTAIDMHRYLPQVGCINWDFTLDEQGEPLLIEANTAGGGIWIFQMAHGCGPFGERTPEILRWMRLMKQTHPDERYKYCMGRMPEDG